MDEYQPTAIARPLARDEVRLDNLTIRVDDYVLLRAQVKAMRESKSINGLLADYLSEYAGVPTAPIERRLPRPVRPRAIYDQAVREARRRRLGRCR